MQPARQAALGFSKAGTVATVGVEIGQQVQKGDVLAKLSQTELLSQKEQLERQLATVGTAEGQAQTNAQLRPILADIERGVIVAPFDGIVVENNLFQGSLARPGQPGIRLFDRANPNLEFDLPAFIAVEIDRERLWEVEINGEKFLSRVRYQSPQQQSTGNVRFVFSSEQPLQPNWNFGQSIKIEFRLPTDKSGFWVPSSAMVRGDGGSWSVMKVVSRSQNAQAGNQTFATKLVDIRIDQTRGDLVLVNGSIDDGDLVVARGLHRIVAGQYVVPRQRDALAKRTDAEPAQ